MCFYLGFFICFNHNWHNQRGFSFFTKHVMSHEKKRSEYSPDYSPDHEVKISLAFKLCTYTARFPNQIYWIKTKTIYTVKLCIYHNIYMHIVCLIHSLQKGAKIRQPLYNVHYSSTYIYEQIPGFVPNISSLGGRRKLAIWTRLLWKPWIKQGLRISPQGVAVQGCMVHMYKIDIDMMT